MIRKLSSKSAVALSISALLLSACSDSGIQVTLPDEQDNVEQQVSEDPSVRTSTMKSFSSDAEMLEKFRAAAVGGGK